MLSRTYDFPSWVDYLADSLFLSVEAVPIECAVAAGELTRVEVKLGQMILDVPRTGGTSSYLPTRKEGYILCSILLE